jgi:hypothetical protein
MISKRRARSATNQVGLHKPRRRRSRQAVAFAKSPAKIRDHRGGITNNTRKASE